MNSIYANNIPQAYTEAIIKLRTWGEEQESRNGPVITSLDPVFLQIQFPKQRVLFDSIRNCNPFFHVMEFVWMMAGENDVRWIEQFNHGFRNYCDPGTDIIHGAYGHRWLKHFGKNQIQIVADMLRTDPTTRRAVISMWDPRGDLSPHFDLPCNTQIMFRVVDEQLDMTVINRSNDLIWGMLGANAVHMTYLHELIAFMSGLEMGIYKVFTNNLHIYTEMPKFKEIWATIVQDDPYRTRALKTLDLLQPGEKYEDLVEDCVELIKDPIPRLNTVWAKTVAWPMRMAYQDRLSGGDGKFYIEIIKAEDWRLACENYVNLREGKEK
jgi:thymidylate synthase